MGNNPSVIQINGNRIDATTGQVIGKKSNLVIDGLVRKAPLAPIIKKSVTRTTHPKRNPSNGGLETPAHKVHSRGMRSKTLMRRLVKVPSMPARTPAKVASPKARTAEVSPARMAKAMGSKKHRTVSHFGSPSVIKSSTQNASARAASGEVVSLGAATPATPAVVRPMPSAFANISNSRLESMLDEALIKADSHKNKLRGKVKKSGGVWQKVSGLPAWATISTVVLVVLVVGLFFAWRTIPELSTKVASLRAHISASVPAYKPAGYSMAGPAVASNNSVTLSYKTEDGIKSYTVREEHSNQDTSSLMAGTKPNQQVQTAQANGIQIVLAGNKAECVSGGQHTTVNGNGGLPSDELLKIAKSACS